MGGPGRNDRFGPFFVIGLPSAGSRSDIAGIQPRVTVSCATLFIRYSANHSHLAPVLPQDDRPRPNVSCIRLADGGAMAPPEPRLDANTGRGKGQGYGPAWTGARSGGTFLSPLRLVRCVPDRETRPVRAAHAGGRV